MDMVDRFNHITKVFVKRMQFYSCYMYIKSYMHWNKCFQSFPQCSLIKYPRQHNP